MLNLSPDHLDRHPSIDGVRRGEGADLREPERRTTGRWSTPTTRRCSRLARRGRAAQRLFARRNAAVAGTRVERGWIVDREWRRGTSGSCRSTRFTCSVLTWWTT